MDILGISGYLGDAIAQLDGNHSILDDVGNENDEDDWKCEDSNFNVEKAKHVSEDGVCWFLKAKLWKCLDCNYIGMKAKHMSEDGVCRFMKAKIWYCHGYKFKGSNCGFETTDELQAEQHSTVLHSVRIKGRPPTEYRRMDLSFACDKSLCTLDTTCGERLPSAAKLREHVEKYHPG